MSFWKTYLGGSSSAGRQGHVFGPSLGVVMTKRWQDFICGLALLGSNSVYAISPVLTDAPSLSLGVVILIIIAIALLKK